MSNFYEAYQKQVEKAAKKNSIYNPLGEVRKTINSLLEKSNTSSQTPTITGSPESATRNNVSEGLSKTNGTDYSHLFDGIDDETIKKGTEMAKSAIDSNKRKKAYVDTPLEKMPYMQDGLAMYYASIMSNNRQAAKLARALAYSVQEQEEASLSKTSSRTVEAPKSDSRYVNDEKGVRFRGSPGLSGDIFGTLSAGTEVKYTGNKIYDVDGYNWAEVEYDGKRGYIADKYLATSNQYKTGEPDSTPREKVEKKDLTPLREKTEEKESVTQKVSSDTKSIKDNTSSQPEQSGLVNDKVYSLIAPLSKTKAYDSIKSVAVSIANEMLSEDKDSAQILGYKPNELEAAYMAQYFFQYLYPSEKTDLESIGKSLGGWSFADEYEYSNETGLEIGVFYKRVGEKDCYVLVNCASMLDITSIDKVVETVNDFRNNFAQPFGNSEDMKDSIEYAIKFVEEHPDAYITFVGHSKGGAEAAANAVATDKDAILINPATTNLSIYGLNAENYNANMKAYIVNGEILMELFRWVSTPIDDMQLIGKKSVFDVLDSLLSNKIMQLYKSIKRHRIEHVIDLFKEEEK